MMLHLKQTGFIFLVLLLALPAIAAPSVNPDIAKTPPMGWNSWNWFGKVDINETIVREVIDAMVDSGLHDAGYNYVVVDGGWRDTKLGPNGELVPHPFKFPGGMKALADYAHSKGLKFGLHTVPGTHDCGGDAVGGLGNEETHVRQFAEWGIDFIKLDKCRSTEGWDEEFLELIYRHWSKLLAECGRDIVFSISAYRYRSWYPEVCHMARTTWDIAARFSGRAIFDEPYRLRGNFLSVMHCAELNDQVANMAGNGYWNDPDMMVTGSAHALSVSQQEAHFALWCIMSSPLILGNDPRVMTEEEKKIVLNPEAIRINQDPLQQGHKIRDGGNQEVWIKKLNTGETAVLLLNRDIDDTHGIELDPLDVAIRGPFTVRDALRHEDLGVEEGITEFEVRPSSCRLLVVKAVPQP